MFFAYVNLYFSDPQEGPQEGVFLLLRRRLQPRRVRAQELLRRRIRIREELRIPLKRLPSFFGGKGGTFEAVLSPPGKYYEEKSGNHRRNGAAQKKQRHTKLTIPRHFKRHTRFTVNTRGEEEEK